MSIETLNLAASSFVLGQVNPIVINLLVGVFLLISLVMILIVLIQRPQGGGIGGAFGASGGGGGAGQTAFGTKTGDVLTGGTIAIFVLFLTFAIVLNFVTRPPEAQPSQPTIVAPENTEALPVDESIDTPTDAVDEGVDETTDAVDPATEPTIEPVTDPATDPISNDEN